MKSSAGGDESPAGHRSGVMMAALGLVERVAFVPVVAFADVAHNLAGIAGATDLQQMNGEVVLKAGHHLGVVGEGPGRALALSSAATASWISKLVTLTPTEAVGAGVACASLCLKLTMRVCIARSAKCSAV